VTKKMEKIIYRGVRDLYACADIIKIFKSRRTRQAGLLAAVET
jgi:hypothetical protein